GLDAGHLDSRMIRHAACLADAPREIGRGSVPLQRVLRRNQPPDLVEVETAQRHQADRPMSGVRRVERAAKEADAHASLERRQPRIDELRLPSVGRPWQRQASAGAALAGQGLTWPDPRMRYLKLVSCSTPTGPRACIRPVAMPISAPMPNSPPSANWVEALCRTMALSSRERKRSAASWSSVTMQSICCEPYVRMCANAASTPSTVRTAMM